VILAAGRGERFGGLKQLAPVRSSGEAIMDLTAVAALDCGYSGAVIVVREEIRSEIAAHLERFWPAELSVEIVCQDHRRGTAAAVAAVRPFVDGPFAVANADDLYGAAALRPLREHLVPPPAGMPPDAEPAERARLAHVLVAYRLGRTILGDRPVNRGLCKVGPRNRLAGIVEHRVTAREDGGYDAVALPRADDAAKRPRSRRLSGDEQVSMNLWGFHPSFLDQVDEALDHFDPTSAPRPELLLPDVAGNLLRTREHRFDVVESDARCIGITYPEDLAVVQDELARGPLEWWRLAEPLAG